MVATSPVMISRNDSVGTSLWAASVASTVLGEIGAFSEVTMAAGWYSSALMAGDVSTGEWTE